jgi:DNA-binding NarL/FixJ family response regulator
MCERIRVVLADDHVIFREGFKAILKDLNDLELVGEAADGKELLTVVDEHAPEVVFTDTKMPQMDGIEASRLLKAKHPSLGIIALSMFDDDHLVQI